MEVTEIVSDGNNVNKETTSSNDSAFFLGCLAVDLSRISYQSTSPRKRKLRMDDTNMEEGPKDLLVLIWVHG